MQFYFAISSFPVTLPAAVWRKNWHSVY